MIRIHFGLALCLLLLFLSGILLVTGTQEDSLLQLDYSTYLGGNGTEGHGDLFFNSEKNLIVVSETSSTDYPLLNPIQSTNKGVRDIIITIIDLEANQLTYSTYLGGDGDDFVSGATIDSNGNIIIVGVTDSTDFPLANPLYTNRTGRDVFLIIFDSKTNAVTLSTYLGEASDYYSIDVITDTDENIIVTGTTDSSSFIGTNVSEVYQNTSMGGTEGFITKLSPNGINILFSTYFGGTADDAIKSVTTDSQNNIFITGTTQSSDLPIVNASITQKSPSQWDIFISKLSPDGHHLDFSTYHGGTRVWGVTRIICDENDDIIVAGESNSVNFPLVNPYQPNYGGGAYDVFVSKFDSMTFELEFSTFLGGYADESPISLTLNTNNDIYISGCTNSADYPIQNSYESGKHAGTDGFVTKLTNNGEMSDFSTFFGGSSYDYITDLIFYPQENDSFLITGHVSSTNFPLVTPLQDSYGGGEFDLIISQFTWIAGSSTTSTISTPTTIPTSTLSTPTTSSEPSTPSSSNGWTLIPLLFSLIFIWATRRRVKR
ncbi:MAG: SBBP repeat-containing protein [Candidatus Heimdallarchaeota archaeon]|nr:MAG: SBBP repeat-containing protein [Candidatus Heimdallarchaeota archaeon]